MPKLDTNVLKTDGAPVQARAAAGASALKASRAVFEKAVAHAGFKAASTRTRIVPDGIAHAIRAAENAFGKGAGAGVGLNGDGKGKGKGGLADAHRVEAFTRLARIGRGPTSAPRGLGWNANANANAKGKEKEKEKEKERPTEPRNAAAIRSAAARVGPRDAASRRRRDAVHPARSAPIPDGRGTRLGDLTGTADDGFREKKIVGLPPIGLDARRGPSTRGPTPAPRRPEALDPAAAAASAVLRGEAGGRSARGPLFHAGDAARADRGRGFNFDHHDHDPSADFPARASPNGFGDAALATAVERLTRAVEDNNRLLQAQLRHAPEPRRRFQSAATPALSVLRNREKIR